MAINCIGLFCEDIREEVGGIHTIVGVMPDNINLMAGGPPPADTKGLLFPKLGIYARINLDASYTGGAITCRVSIPGISDIALGSLEADFVQNAVKEAKARKFPTVGLLFKSIVSPLTLKEPGLAKIIVTVDGNEIVCGALNIEMHEITASPTAPQPHV
jgi:hypothetical protein